MITIGSLFSGACDGIALGLEWAGLGPVLWHAEIDPWRHRVLARHWPDAIGYADVREVIAESPRVDLLCGGFPCTNVSVMGNSKGLDGDESGLWSEMLRVIQTLEPSIVFVENVAALRTASGGDCRCVCGWHPGRRRLYRDRPQHPEPHEASLLDRDRREHEREGSCGAAVVAQELRRLHLESASADRTMVSDVQLAYLRGSRAEAPPSSATLPTPEERASGHRYPAPRNTERASRTLGTLDADRSSLDEGEDPHSQPQGTDEHAAVSEDADAPDCPFCGWSLGSTPRLAVSRTALGRVLGDLAALGFDASWCCLRGTDVGYPVDRERIFIVACADEGGRTLLRAAHDLDRGDASWDLAHRRGACRPPPGPRDGAALRAWTAEHGGNQPGVRRSTPGLSKRVERVGTLGDSAMPLLVVEAWRRLSQRFAA